MQEEKTGLGGSGLSFQDKADITVRTDKHKQNIYRPSMTTVEPVLESPNAMRDHIVEQISE